jgi:cell division transport system ATP-binding protein
MIVFDNVTKKFPLGNIALENASFQIEDNEFVFLVGPSGAGKTTILKLILKDLNPTKGSIMVNDIDITDKKFNKIEQLRRKVGVIFQDFKILPDKNIFENVSMSLKVMNIPNDQIKDEVYKTIELVGLLKKILVFPAQLSAGELQRVAIARAIIGNRDIILADEPTGNLDPKTAWTIMKIFKKIDGKKTILFATHNTDIVNSLQKRVLVLKEGKIEKDLRKGGYEI